MQLKQGNFCPLVNGDCKQLECRFFVKLAGTHPTTGVVLDEWDCSFSFLPVLMVQTANSVRGLHAATESHRNVIAKAMGIQPLAEPHVITQAPQPKLIGGN